MSRRHRRPTLMNPALSPLGFTLAFLGMLVLLVLVAKI
jgi:hypothetical protein